MPIISTASYYADQPRQREFHLCSAKWRLYGGAMSGGKTYAICAEGLKLSLLYPGNRGFVGRKTLRSLKRTTMVTFFRVCPPELIANYNKTELTVTLINGSLIEFGELNISADPLLEKNKSLEIGWFAIDEASEVDGKYFAFLTTRLRWVLPNGRRPRYTGFMGTNPEMGWCYDGFVQPGNHGNRAFIPSLPTDNRFNTPEYLSDMLENLTKEDIQRFYFGNWLAANDPRQLISYQSMKQAHELEILLATDLALGVDVARYGDDLTVLTLLNRTGDEYMTEVKTWEYEKTSTTEVADIVAGLMLEYRIPASRVVVDVGGLGAGTVDSLADKNISCISFVGGAVPLEDESSYTYRNLRSQGYWYLRKHLHDNQLALQLDNVRLKEVTSVRYDVSSDKMITIESKDKIKKRLSGKSPDKADALMMAIMAYPMEQENIMGSSIF